MNQRLQLLDPALLDLRSDIRWHPGPSMRVDVDLELDALPDQAMRRVLGKGGALGVAVPQHVSID